MILPWRRTFSGGDVVLCLPEGPEAGHIRVREQQPGRPRLRQLLEPILAAAPGASVEGPAPLVTAEGEMAALVNLVDARHQRTTAFIFADESYCQIDGMVTVPEHFPAFRQAVTKLTYGHCMGLGTDRWRRFYYEPPRGWTGVARPRETMWIAPSCPRLHQVIKVYDARPPRLGFAATQRRQLIESVPAEVAKVQPSPPEPFRTRDELPGEIIVYRGEMPERGAFCVVDAIALESRYAYRFRLECDEAAYPQARVVFDELVTSMRPVPARRPDDTVLSTWQE